MKNTAITILLGFIISPIRAQLDTINDVMHFKFVVEDKIIVDYKDDIFYIKHDTMNNQIINKIPLDEYYHIDIDAYNWALRYIKVSEKINEKTGKPSTRRDEWYFPNLRLCLQKYLDQSLKESDSLDQILIRLDEVEKKIDQIFYE